MESHKCFLKALKMHILTKMPKCHNLQTCGCNTLSGKFGPAEGPLNWIFKIRVFCYWDVSAFLIS